jgi:hypothetical protein
MSSSTIVRWGALAAIGGGVMFVVASLLPLSFPQASEVFSVFEVFSVVAIVLIPVGMVGFHTLQKGSYGLIGRAGFWTVVIAALAWALSLAAYLWWGISGLLWLAFPVGPLGLLVGFALYGAACVQAKVLPRWCGVAFIVAVPIALFLMRFGVARSLIWFGLVWLALGYMLWSRRGATAEQPPTPRVH